MVNQIGKINYKNYLLGKKRLTEAQAIECKCYDCTGGYADGSVDCGMPECPLYFWMPYKNIKDEV